MNNPRTVTLQPGDIQHTEWNDGLCACGNDCKDGALTCFCYWCKLCCIAKEFRECCALPMILPMFEVIMGVQHRARQHIKGTVCCDLCQWFWCPPCYVCRLSRDMKYRKLHAAGLN
ncbi:unnamed protein product [Calicophoron daubneyi]|uniref:Uncharacterized protein n=1 Tax=Calicophoron daubneyi TaxID=300641 RepID=A0AAV2T3E7_CALDB